MTNLTKLYKELNAQFFRGRLPRCRVTLVKSMLALRGKCLYPERRLIRISRNLPQDEVRRVLLHEMCHIGTPNHGKRFQAKLMRLAEMGETWAAQEAEDYRTSPTATDWAAWLRQEIGDLLLQRPDVKFWSAVRWLAHDQGRTSGELLRAFPWFRAAWKKSKAEARAYYALRKHRREPLT